MTHAVICHILTKVTYLEPNKTHRGLLILSFIAGIMSVSWHMARRAVEKHTQWLALSVRRPVLQCRTHNRASSQKQPMNCSSKTRLTSLSQTPVKITLAFIHLQFYAEDCWVTGYTDVYNRLISEKPSGSHTVEMSVVEVYNNEVVDLLARDEDGATVGVKREVITTSTGTSEVPCLSYEWVTAR